MQNFFKKLSIKTKLSMVIMLTCTLLLFVIGGVVMVAQGYSSRMSLEQELRILASSLAENLRQPLVLGKYEEAEGLLGALNRQSNIHAAYLFAHDGAPVAEYLTQKDSPFVLAALRSDFQDANRAYWTSLENEKNIGDWRHLSSFTPVFFAGNRVGTLYLLSDLHRLYGGLSGVAFGIILALMLLVAFSWLLAAYLQQPVSAPILELAALMRGVSTHKDYSIRARKDSHDEIGVLVDGFNSMLRQIELHQLRIAQHQQHLEQTVAERTGALRSAVAALEVARQQADAANEAKSDFLSRMTHELRTPLIGVLGMNELLARSSLDEQQRMLVNTVQQSGEELLRLISDVLDFSRIEAGKLELEESAAEFYRLVEDVVSLLSPKATEKGIRLITDIPLNATWKVRVDETRVRQILMNLIGNAIKFTAEGSVIVSLRMGTPSAGQARFVLEVADTGCGMDEKSAAQVFDVFYQADGSSTREQSGAGLGLAIVKQLVDLMQGELSLESVSGQGSRFRVALDLTLVEKSGIADDAGLRRAPLLLCTGKDTAATLLEQRLRELSFDPIITHTAADALYQLASAKREGRYFASMILDRDTCLPTGQPLYLAIREDLELRFMRRILLVDNRGGSVSVAGAESRLYLPVSWSSLCAALHDKRRELSLATDKTASAGQGSDADSLNLPRVLVVSRHAASRELLRLTLEQQKCQVDTLNGLSELPAQLETKSYLAVFFDHAHLPAEDLIALLRSSGPVCRNRVLIHEERLDEGWHAVSEHVLKKPVTSRQLEAVFQQMDRNNADQPILKGVPR